MSSSSSSRATVTFDVGGTHQYKVSRTLLDQYPSSMLAKICSETWQQGATTTENQGEGTIFIDRNGERFQYVLDFMRDASVELPTTIPRAQFIKDLEYLGIDFTSESITIYATAIDLRAVNARFVKRAKTVESRYRQSAVEMMALKAERKFRTKIVQDKIAAESSSTEVSIRETVMTPRVTAAELEVYLKPAGLKLMEIEWKRGYDETDDNELDANETCGRQSRRVYITMSFLE